MKTKRHVFTPLIEDGKPAYRVPKIGEWVRNPEGSMWRIKIVCGNALEIGTCVDEEVEIADPPKLYSWVRSAVMEWRTNEPSTSPRLDEVVSRRFADASPMGLIEHVRDMARELNRLGFKMDDALSREIERLVEIWKKE